MLSRRIARLCCACLFTTLVASVCRPAWAENEESDAKRQQAAVKAETEQMVRRVGTMLRVLEYYRLDKTAEKKLLGEVASTLSSLSREQMAEVLARLDAASKAKTQAQATREMTAARERHQEILRSLKGLLSRYDAVKTLDQAAEKLEKAATQQFDLGRQSARTLQDLEDAQNARDLSQKERNQLIDRLRNQPQAMKQQADEQAELNKYTRDFFKEAAKLKDQLPAGQQERLKKVEKMAEELRVLERMTQASRKLATRQTNPAVKHEQWKAANELQTKTAGDLRELARSLRRPQDKMQALKEARDRIDQAIKQQDELREQAKEMDRQQARELSDRQARLEQQTRDAQGMLKPHAEDLAKKLDPAQEAMREAEKALRTEGADQAKQPQEKAADTLREVRKDLDKLLAKGDKGTNDPLAALKKAADNVEQLIKEQKQTRAQTQQASAARDSKQFPQMAGKQQDLAKRTESVKKEPMPAKAQTRAALDKAAKAMASAAKDLKATKGEQAVAKQDNALKALEEAKKALNNQIAETEKRREDIAKLEDAAKKLNDLTRQQGKIADQAKQMADKTAAQKAKELASKQAAVTPQAKDVGKQIEKAAPEAAKKVNDSAKKMEAARANFEKNKPAPAAKQAKNAAQKLKDAQKEIARALEQQKAKEAADQAAMQPRQIDLDKAAEQVAKALEQTQKAQEASKQAAQQPQAKQSKQQQADLAKLQKQVGEKAAQLDVKNAKKPADQAAEALKKGDFNKALEKQQNALARLQDAARNKEPMDNAAKAPQTGEAKPAPQPKAGEPKAGQPKTGQPKAGQPKQSKQQPSLTKAGNAKSCPECEGGAQGGQPKASQVKSGQGQQSAPTPGEAQNPGQLAQAQKALMDATKQAAKSQEATQGAMGALGQAQAQSPETVQKQLQEAGKQLAQANKQLQKGAPSEASKAQGQAAEQLKRALEQIQAAQKQGQPGQPGEQVANANGEQGQKQGQPQGKGQAPGQGKGQAPSQEKNQLKGTGDRIADGKVSNAKSQLSKFKEGDGSFLHLPPRQREMIRQTMSGRLPPEFAALIQQYFANIARGLPATAPKMPGSR